MKQYVATSIFTGGVGDGYHGSSGYHGHDDDDQSYHGYHSDDHGHHHFCHK